MVLKVCKLVPGLRLNLGRLGPGLGFPRKKLPFSEEASNPLRTSF